jgi:tetratricopeptide (TPR) repeat protein
MKNTLIALLTSFCVVFAVPSTLEARGAGNKDKKQGSSRNSNNQSRNKPNKAPAKAPRSPLTQSQFGRGNTATQPRDTFRDLARPAPVSSKPKPAAKPKPSSGSNNNRNQGSNNNRNQASNQKGNQSKGNQSKGNSKGSSNSKGKGNSNQNSKGSGNSKGNSKGAFSRPGPSYTNIGGTGRPVPGIVKYPAKPTPKPGAGKNPSHSQKGKAHGSGNNHANHNHHSNKRPNRVNQVITSNQVRNSWGNRWTQSNTVWNQNYNTIRGPVIVNNNYRNSLNYAHRPNAWGSRPWWCSQSQHNWHHGSWNYGYNNRYSNRHRYLRPSPRPTHYLPGYHSSHVSVSSAIPWGIAAWSLGRLIYDTGYSSYRNPYNAPPVQTHSTVYNYSQPITVVASREEPLAESEEANDAEKSSAALEKSRSLFGEQDYLGALKAVDESISYVPGDPAIHEFRALTLFALGQYGEAAGVLNPVLATGPGWDWATMVGFYRSSDTYAQQLRKLEDYVSGNPESAGAGFLLGYHYMVSGFLEEAYQVFDRVVELEPGDQVARQLRDLARDSIPSDDEPEMADGDALELEEDLVILEPEQIAGIWKADSAEGKEITLSIPIDGDFMWEYEGAEEKDVLSGDWSIDEDGLLVLDDEDAQLVARIELTEDGEMKFVLAGSPDSDPGLIFSRQ